MIAVPSNPNRFQVFGLHLAISAAVVFTVLWVMLGIWYPGGYFKAMGGGKLLFILAGVDICLGPLLTLVVFKPGKPGLKFDLTVIALAQACALAYGIWVMSQARPLFTVFTKDQFQIAAPADLDAARMREAREPEWRTPSWGGPRVVYADIPTDPRQKQELIASALAGMDVHQFPRYYDRYEKHGKEVLAVAKPLGELESIASGNKAVIQDFLSTHPGNAGDYVFVPLRTHWEEMAAILDAKTARFVAIIPATPWK